MKEIAEVVKCQLEIERIHKETEAKRYIEIKKSLKELTETAYQNQKTIMLMNKKINELRKKIKEKG